MCVGADQIGLQHEFGNLAGIVFGHPGFAHGIDDQASNGRRWNPYRLG